MYFPSPSNNFSANSHPSLNFYPSFTTPPNPS